MKVKVMKNISKRIMAGFMAVALVVTGVVIVPKTTEAASATEVYFDTEGKYPISKYWSKAEKKVPVKDGYVFSGWYAADKTTPLKETELSDEKVGSITAIAKFVPAEVLSIKTQAALGDETVDTSISSLRILSTVDSTNYQEVGFEYKLGTQPEAKTEGITKVYSAIKPYKGADDKDLIYPGNTFVKAVSQYFIAADVSSIIKTSDEKIVYARPYWVTMDGTEVMGHARNNRIVDKRNDNQYASVGINLLTGLNFSGKTEVPAAAVAAGKIQVTYNAKDFDVHAVDTTYSDKEGGKYLFPEMECSFKEEGDKGIITFVGNAVIKDGTLADLTADGLFANVRFKQTTTTENAAVNLTITTTATEFCNWAEETVTNFVVQ